MYGDVSNCFFLCIDPDMADISRIFCEVIRSELNANPPSDLYIHQKPVNNQIGNGGGTANSSLQQQFAIQHHQQHGKQTPSKSEFQNRTESNRGYFTFFHSSVGTFMGQHDDHLHMFTVDGTDNEVIEECGIYTSSMDGSMDNSTSDDFDGDGSREPCSYEWTDDIDVINVLHGVPDWPVSLQVHVDYNDSNKNTIIFIYLNNAGCGCWMS